MPAFEGFGTLPPIADQPLAEPPQPFKDFFRGLFRKSI